MGSTFSINPTSGAADLSAVHPDETGREEASFRLALAKADAANARSESGLGAPTLSLDQSALHAADEAWVNFVAYSEQLQNPNLSQEKQNALLEGLVQNLRTFRNQSGPLVEQVDNFFASRQASSAKSAGQS